jgi:sarcosine oxidase gamma subunit
LEADPQLRGRLKFRTNEFVMFINDRLLAPNTPQTFDAVKFDIENVARTVYAGANVELEHYASGETLFEVHVRASEAPDIATLLSRVGAGASA